MVERGGSHKGARHDVSSFPSFWSGLESGNCCFGNNWLLRRGREERDRDRFDDGLDSGMGDRVNGWLDDGFDDGLDDRVEDGFEDGLDDGLEDGVGDRHRLPTLTHSLTITLLGRLTIRYCQDFCQRRRNSALYAILNGVRDSDGSSAAFMNNGLPVVTPPFASLTNQTRDGNWRSWRRKAS